MSDAKELSELKRSLISCWSKYELLNLVKSVYKKDIKIIIDKKVKINRSLNSNLLQKQTGYKPPNWTKLIQEMFEFYMYK